MAEETPKSRGKKRKAEDDGRETLQKAAYAPKYGRRMITVKVGEENEIFDVHEELLTRHSDFFQKAISGAWKESQDRTVTLPEETPEVFEIFYHFVYTGVIYSSKDNDFREDQPGETRPFLIGFDAEWDRLPMAWLLGERLFSTSFKDAIVDAIINKMNRGNSSPAEMHTTIYPRSLGSSKIRKLLVDIAVWGWEIGLAGSRDRGETWDDFFFDVLKAMDEIKITGRKGVAPYKEANTCIYHEHSEGQACYKTMF